MDIAATPQPSLPSLLCTHLTLISSLIPCTSSQVTDNVVANNTMSELFNEANSSSRRRGFRGPSMDSDELINLLHHSDPVKVELNGLENEVGDVNTAPSATFLHICS
ncbi:hypothetical protein ACFXTI_040916 [Malus domestica]